MSKIFSTATSLVAQKEVLRVTKNLTLNFQLVLGSRLILSFPSYVIFIILFTFIKVQVHHL